MNIHIKERMKEYRWLWKWSYRSVIAAFALTLTACGGGGGFAREDGGTFGTAINPPPGKVLVQGAVFDEETGIALSDVEVSDTAPTTEIQQKSVPVGVTRTDSEGKFTLQAQPDQNRDIELFFRRAATASAASFSLESVPQDAESIDLLVDINTKTERATPRSITVQLRDQKEQIPHVNEQQHLGIVEGSSEGQTDNVDFGDGSTGGSAPIGSSVDDIDLVR